jgi:hypothetical protein
VGSFALLWLPLAAFVALVLTGGGLAVLLGRGFPRDGQAALAAPLGAAAFFCASPLLYVGVPVKPLGAAVLVAGGLVTVYARVRVLRVLRHGAGPLAAGAVALLFASAPLAVHGNWDAAAIENADPYLWVSQAKSFLDGPPSSPATSFPDRIAYERIDELHWPVGLPFSLSQIAWLGSADPAAVYGAFAAVLAVLLALTVYGSARACLHWPRGLALVASALVSANALLLYSNLNGWQAQVALTSFGLLSVFFFRLALGPRARWRERLLAAIAITASLAAYGVLVAPFALLLFGVGVGALVAQRFVAWRRILWSAAAVTGLTIVLGLGPVIQSLRQIPVVMGLTDSPAWKGYAHGLPAEGLGLIPRFGTALRPPIGWSVLALAVTAALMAFAFWPGERTPRRYRDALVSTSAISLAAVALLQLPGVNPYLSIKILGYVAPLLTMFAVAGLAGRRPFPRTRVATLGAAGTLFVASTASVVAEAFFHLQTTERLASVQAELPKIPPGAGFELGVRDGWTQSWLVYYLRDRPVTVREPTEFLTGFGARERGLGPAGRSEYVIAYGHRDDALWEIPALVVGKTRVLVHMRSRVDRHGLIGRRAAAAARPAVGAEE